MPANGAPPRWTPARVWRAGILGLCVPLAALLGGAGTVAWPAAWFCALFQVPWWLVTLQIIMKTNPDLMEERGRFTRNPGVPTWEKHTIRAFVIITAAMYLAAGLQRRWQPAVVPLAPPHALTFLAVATADAALLLLQCWAHLENRFFSSVVRIQSDRGHTLCDTGPYAWVRHPAYVGTSLQYLLEAALLRSSWAAWLAGVRAVLLLARTLGEDAFLRPRLPGYADYMARVRWRWVPGVW